MKVNRQLKIKNINKTSKGISLVLICLLLYIIAPCSSYAQNRKELEQKRIKLQQEIKEINSLLFKSQKEEENLLSALNDLNRRIAVRTKLIATINEENEEITLEIAKNEKEVDQLQNRLNDLKDDYANMVVQSYKSKTQQSRLMFILSSENFLQAYKRLEYINQYAKHRQQQGEEIKVEALKLKNLNDYLDETRTAKEDLLLVNKLEKDSISREKKSQVSLVNSVKKRERKYITQINKKQKEEKEIDRKITKLIRDAIAKSNKKNNAKT